MGKLCKFSFSSQHYMGEQNIKQGKIYQETDKSPGWKGSDPNARTSLKSDESTEGDKILNVRILIPS